MTFNRVVAIFRTLGYSRGSSNLAFAIDHGGDSHQPDITERRPAGGMAISAASPAARCADIPRVLANLSAYYLDQRLSGLAKSFEARYSRYADDLTFSGDESLDTKLRLFIQLVELVIRAEQFHSNRKKRQVLRRHQRQIITGVVVNERPNVCRRDFDTLKAILTNCVNEGPTSQNREQHPNFTAHLAGRIAHIAAFHPARAEKLRGLYARIDWSR